MFVHVRVSVRAEVSCSLWFMLLLVTVSTSLSLLFSHLAHSTFCTVYRSCFKYLKHVELSRLCQEFRCAKV